MDIGLYVHVPFCATKCGYCDFYSHAPAPGVFTPLVDALLDELASALSDPDLSVETIFVGGGTPTLLPAGPLERLFAALGLVAQRHRPVEFTVEANPASLTDAKARLLRAHGVNRVSMGAQSFHAHELRVLDRIHSPHDIAPSAEIIRRSGFEHFNLDLIFGIPGQTRASWLESLRRAIACGPDHLACYGLTYEPDTALHDKLRTGLIRPADEGFEAELYDLTVDFLTARGFQQYEISNYARPGAGSRHNVRYWLNLPYVGIGPSAASFLNGRRWRNLPDTAEYVRRRRLGLDTAIDAEMLSPRASAGETAMLNLRLVEGMDRAAFHAATGFDPLVLFAEPIARYAGQGLLAVDDRRIRLTRRGRLVADTVLADFLATAPDRPEEFTSAGRIGT
ncbi:MAG: radical SAM family heme chaperone HemW [Phycisphaerae bacterium]|jgi:oxygen-independent coproporphyrinogen-3 oxidase